MKVGYDKRHRVRELPELSKGDRVWVPDLNRFEFVAGPVPGALRSYMLATKDAPVRRNRSMLISMENRAPDRTLESTSTNDRAHTISPHIHGQRERNSNVSHREPLVATSPIPARPVNSRVPVSQPTGPEAPVAMPAQYCSRYGRQVRPPDKLNL